jgi:molybdopterin-guanine dinucleotide biosynthesis protein A
MNTSAPLLGLVLAGGLSNRMGTDKATLEIAGVSLLERAVATLTQCVDQVFVSISALQATDTARSCYAVIEDRFEGIGPAAGILSAHLHAPKAAWLVIACDMPLLDVSSIRRLIRARVADQDATAWASADASVPEPLCAIYEPGTLAAFLDLVSVGGDPSPRAWLEAARTHLLPEPRPEVLDGTNTREEFALLSQRLDAQTGAAARNTKTKNNEPKYNESK